MTFFSQSIVLAKYQSSDMKLDVAVNGLKGLLKFLKNYRDTGFTSTIVDAKDIATNLKIYPMF